MNLIDVIDFNPFLRSLFPYGLDNNLLVGNMRLDLGGHVWVSFHTSQQPDKKVNKWGCWGEDYNILVINLCVSGIMKLYINNWAVAHFCKLNINKEPEGFLLTQKNNDWSLELKAQHFSFQNCDIYLD